MCKTNCSNNCANKCNSEKNLQEIYRELEKNNPSSVLTGKGIYERMKAQQKRENKEDRQWGVKV